MNRKYSIFLVYWIVLSGASIWILGTKSGIIHIGNEILLNGILLAPILLTFLVLSRNRARKNGIIPTHSLIREWSEQFASILTVISALSYLMLGALVYQYALHNPARLPIYKIETGDKNITLISMAHIASPEFYKNVQERVYKHLSQSGSVVYYEGVKSGSASGNIKLKQILNTDLSEFYDNIAMHAGLVSQTESNTLTANDREYNVDLSSDEIVRLYEERKAKNNPSNDQSMQVLFPDEDLGNLSQLLQVKNDREKQLQILLLRAMFSLSTRHQAFFGQELIGGGDPFFDTILIDRNQHVVDTIKKGQDKDILILYGSLHMQGIIDLLRSADPNLKQQFIESIPLF